MKVLLGFAEVNYHRIFVEYGDFEHLMPPLSLYVLAGCLRDAGHDVEVLDPAVMELDGPPVYHEVDLEFDDHEFLTRAAVDRISAHLRQTEFTSLRRAAERADLVGISGNTFGWPTALRMIQEVRAVRPDVPIVLGGPHPTYIPDHVIRATGVEYVLRGEGERGLVELVDALDGGGDRASRGSLADIAGLTYWRGGEVVHNPGAEPLSIDYLEGCPLPAFDLLPTGKYPTINLETSRGCKFACKFCSIPFQLNWRGLSPDAVDRRIDHAIGYVDRLRYAAPDPLAGGFRQKRVLNFVDDTFSRDKARGAEILGRVVDRDIGALDLELSYEARATEFCDPEISDHLARIPLQMLLIGADCGYDEGLKKVGKGLTTKSIRLAAATADEKGFIGGLVFAFILGYPWESTVECKKTLDFAWELASKHGANTNINWLLCLPGSYFWNHRQELGFDVGPEDYDAISIGTFQLLRRNAVGLSDEDIVEVDAHHRHYKALGMLTGIAGGIHLRHAK